MKVLLVFFIALLTGCQSNLITKDDRPDWWLTPPQDSEQWLYGLGEGASLEAANQQALANLAGKLRTNISATLSRRTQEAAASSDDLIDRQISSRIAQIPLSNYETFKTQNLDYSVITIVRVNKTSLANDWLRQHQTISQEIDNAISADTMSRFQWWSNARSLSKEADKGDQLAELYTALSGELKNSHLKQKLSEALLNKKPSASIKGKDSAINRELKSQLISEGIQVNHCQKCDLTLSYETSFNSEVLFDENIVRLSFNGALRNNEGTFSSSQWQLNASSVQGLQAGKNATLYLALQKIKEEGLWKAFGMEAK